MFKNIIFIVCFAVLLTACNNKNNKMPQVQNYSFSNYTEAKVTHLDWVASLDFAAKTITASATWHFTNSKNVKNIILDTKNVSVNKVTVSGKEVTYILDTTDHDYLGSALSIPISETDSVLCVYYQTSPNAKAIQWLTAQQTADKKMPYLFTQCEAISCRSFIPCQDAPAVRITYNAQVTVPKGMMAAMSANNPQQRNATGVYHFDMEIPVPSYLIALAVGDIDFKAIDARSGVYAEPSILQNATWELGDIPKMISAAEKLAGPYRWKRYDVLVQPPSFPIGGMENPKLTFATPTILAGDKSLVSLIAHELAHSWSGNTVTNATWDDIWLNEGFTTYFERRIMENITDTSYSDMLWELSYQDMMADVKEYGEKSEATKLKVNLTNHDPEDGFTNIPYEKGAHFLWLIERTVGRPVFDSFMVNYFNENAYKPMTTEMALAYMDKNLWNKNPAWKKTVGVEEWVYNTGIPANCPRPNHTRFDAVDAVRKTFETTSVIATTQTTKWTTHEWLQFLRLITPNIGTEKMEILDKKFHFTATKNSEIAFEWYMLSIKNNFTKAYIPIQDFLMHVGRKKFVLPIYKSLLAGNAEQKTLATTIFSKAKDNYHPATTQAVEVLFKGK